MKHSLAYIAIRSYPSAHVIHFRVGRFARSALLFLRSTLILGTVLFALLSLLFLAGHSRKFYAYSQNEYLKGKLNAIHSELSQLDEWNNFISDQTLVANLRFGLDRPKPSVIARGVGGPVPMDTVLLRTVPAEKMQQNLRQKSITLKRGIEESIQQLSDLEAVAQQKLLAWRYLPSIKPTTGYVTSIFGQRQHPVTGEIKPHEGLDIANVPWTPIVATADGIVAEVAFRPGAHYGKYVRIDHGNGYQTLYAHLAQATVKQGQFIHRHQLIGHMGSTGRVTGPHLHYEVRLDGQPINPVRFILPSSVIVD